MSTTNTTTYTSVQGPFNAPNNEVLKTFKGRDTLDAQPWSNKYTLDPQNFYINDDGKIMAYGQTFDMKQTRLPGEETKYIEVTSGGNTFQIPINQTSLYIDPARLKDYKYKVENGEYYRADDDGNYILSKIAPSATTGVKTIVTGQIKTDPFKYYSISGYDTENLDGYKLTRDGRRAQRQAIKAVLGKRGEVDTSFEKMLGNSTPLTKKELLDPETRQRLLESYSITNDPLSMSREYGSEDQSQALTLRNLLYPEMRKKTSSGHFTSGKEKEWRKKLTWKALNWVPGCPNCGEKGHFTGGLTLGDVKKDVFKVRWHKPNFDVIEGGLTAHQGFKSTTDTYGYAVPIQPTTSTTTELRQTDGASSTHSNTGYSHTTKVPITATKNGNKKQKQKTVTIKNNASVASSKKSSQNEERTVTIKTYPDGTQEKIVGGWQVVNKQGGNINYLNYFK